MKDREGFLFKMCIVLFVLCSILGVLFATNSCSSSSKVVIYKEVI